jgi:hypothetical protein
MNIQATNNNKPISQGLDRELALGVLQDRAAAAYRNYYALKLDTASDAEKRDAAYEKYQDALNDSHNVSQLSADQIQALVGASICDA